MAEEIVRYRAKSAAQSFTIGFNVLAAIVAALAVPEVSGMIPPEWLPFIAAFTAVGNVALRFKSVRPVALIGIGKSKVVEVAKIAEPAVPTPKA